MEAEKEAQDEYDRLASGETFGSASRDAPAASSIGLAAGTILPLHVHRIPAVASILFRHMILLRAPTALYFCRVIPLYSAQKTFSFNRII
jgi:hypothetical protein